MTEALALQRQIQEKDWQILELQRQIELERDRSRWIIQARVTMNKIVENVNNRR